MGRPGPDGAVPGDRPRTAAAPLVGRDRQLTQLDELLQRSLSGAFRVALLTGAAGLGKTRLATEALARYDDAITLSSRSYRWGATTSFGPWIEALDRHLRRQDPDDLLALIGTSQAELSVLLKTVEAVTGPPQHEPDRARLLEALVDLFDRLSTDAPVLIALDDIHLADATSWEALRYLGRRLTDSPIGVVATARPGELGRLPIASEVLVGLDEDGLLQRIELDRLTAAEITALAHDQLRADSRAASTFVPASLVSWLVERSMGHPLFAIGLLEALLDEGADLSAPRLERLPVALRERVSLDLGGLEPEHRLVLEVLAVVDRRIDLAELGRLSELGEEQLALALETLVRARLVSEQRSGAELTFDIAHPIIQDTIYEEIGGARRRALHRTVARTLAAAGHLGAAAGHFSRAAEPGDDEAVDALCRAMGQAEARGLAQEALATLAALLDVLPPDDPRWLTVLGAMDWQSEWVLSHLAENDASTAIAAMERIEAHVHGSDDLAARATVRFHLAAFLSFGAGRLDEAEHACRDAVELFERAGETEPALLARNELAWIRGCAGDFVYHAELAGEVLETADWDGHRRAATQAAGTAAYAYGVLGRFETAARLFQRSIELAEQDHNTYRTAWARAQGGWLLGLSGRLDDGIASVEASLRLDPRAPDALALEYLAHCHWLAGDLEAALDDLDRSAIRRPVGGSRRRAWGAALAARLHAEMGRRGRAQASLEQAIATYENEPFLAWGFWAPWTAALLVWQADGPAPAVEALTGVAAQLGDSGAAPYEALVLTELAEAAADAGDVDACNTAAGRVADLASTLDGSLSTALAATSAAMAGLTTGAVDAAADEAAEAARKFDAAGHRLHAGTALHAAGRATEARDRAAAVATLQEAAAVLDRCGAVWRRDRVLSDLARLGSQGRRAAAAVQGPSALTPREREVAVFAAQGYTAAEIGERLFIGRRTVESHLASCYAKLGVTSKRELVRRADELGLADTTTAP